MRFDSRRGRQGKRGGKSSYRGSIGNEPQNSSSLNLDGLERFVNVAEEIGFGENKSQRVVLAQKLEKLNNFDVKIKPTGYMSIKLSHSNVDLEADVICSNYQKEIEEVYFGLGIKLPGEQDVYLVIPDMTKTSFSELAQITEGIKFLESRNERREE